MTLKRKRRTKFKDIIILGVHILKRFEVLQAGVRKFWQIVLTLLLCTTFQVACDIYYGW